MFTQQERNRFIQVRKMCIGEEFPIDLGDNDDLITLDFLCEQANVDFETAKEFIKAEALLFWLEQGIEECNDLGLD